MNKMAVGTAEAPAWAHLDLNQIPSINVSPPGTKSKELHARCTKYFKGLSGQVKLFPVVFDRGKGGYGNYVLLKRVNNHWIIEKQVPCWIA